MLKVSLLFCAQNFMQEIANLMWLPIVNVLIFRGKSRSLVEKDEKGKMVGYVLFMDSNAFQEPSQVFEEFFIKAKEY